MSCISVTSLLKNNMLTEDFFIQINGEQYKISTALPIGPENVDHKVWKDDKLLFILHPHTNQCDEPCWKLKAEYADENVNKELVQLIGEKIELHYV
jgi:hypothetical protein